MIRFPPLILVRWTHRDPSLLTPAILTSSPPTHKLSTVEHSRLQGIWQPCNPEFLEQEPRLGRRSVQRTQRMDKLNHHFTRLHAHELVRCQHRTKKIKMNHWLKWNSLRNSSNYKISGLFSRVHKVKGWTTRSITSPSTEILLRINIPLLQRT